MEYKITFEQYQKGLEEGKFIGLKCDACGGYTFPPMAVCRKCGGTIQKVSEIGGRGVLKTFTVIRVPPEGKKAPYIVAMAELEEGAWVIGNLEGINPDEADISLIGKEVTLGSRLVEGDTYTAECRVLTFHMETG